MESNGFHLTMIAQKQRRTSPRFPHMIQFVKWGSSTVPFNQLFISPSGHDEHAHPPLMTQNSTRPISRRKAPMESGPPAGRLEEIKLASNLYVSHILSPCMMEGNFPQWKISATGRREGPGDWNNLVEKDRLTFLRMETGAFRYL